MLVGRDSVRKWSSILLLAFIPSFAGATYFGTSFEIRLAIWFFLTLAFFHWAYSLTSGLTGTGVKMIDYYYLSIAAVGVFVLAVGTDQMRSELQRETAEGWRKIYSRSQAALQGKRQDAATAATNYRDVVCDKQLFSDEEECSFGSNLATTVQRDNIASWQVESALVEVRLRNNFAGPLNHMGLTPAQRAKIDPPFDDLTQLRLPAFVAELKVSEQAKQYSVFNPPTPPSRRARFHQSTLWPFILAAAFALRLTKVTIEIGDWTADKKHPPTERAAA